MAASKRWNSEMKRQYKEKFIIMYDRIFRGEDLTSPNFWNELFLIRPIATHIQSEIMQLNEDSLHRCKQNICLLIYQSINALKDKSVYRIFYSLQTLSSILFSMFKKTHNTNTKFNINNLILEIGDMEENMNTLIQSINLFLKGEYPSNLKGLCIKFLLIIATGTDNINQNILIGYVMSSSTFESLLQILRDTDLRNQHGYSIVLILTLLVNYRKHESANSFIVKLSILDDELALNGYGQVIFNVLYRFCKQFSPCKSDMHVSWLVSLTSIIGSMFLDDEEAKYRQIRENSALLLALYEVTHLNRNFITTLAYTQSDSSSTAILNNILTSNQLSFERQISDINAQPINLLAIFFQYCSIVIQSTYTETIIHNVKLCFLVLSCISEDEYANSLMHDANLAFRVQLCKMPMHHRKLNTTAPSSQPLAATLLDLMVEFITSHMMKKFPLELYHHCIGILLRMLCYQKRCRIRLVFQWINLWTVLINLLKFISSHENYLVKKMNIFSLATEVVNVLNIFITYGDMFLSSPNNYDELFYEIIRMELIFVNMNTMGLRYSSIETYEFKESAGKLTNALINMREILSYFPSKINEWLIKENITTPTEEQIMSIIIKHYDNLTLKLQDNLDQFDRYSEHPRHFEFLHNLVTDIIVNTRASISIITLDADTILEDFCNSI